MVSYWNINRNTVADDFAEQEMGAVEEGALADAVFGV